MTVGLPNAVEHVFVVMFQGWVLPDLNFALYIDMEVRLSLISARLNTRPLQTPAKPCLSFAVPPVDLLRPDSR